MEPLAYNSDVIRDVIVKTLDEREWTQKELADRLGVRPQTVNKWVSGENSPPMERWTAIEDALEIDRGTLWSLVLTPDAAAAESPGPVSGTRQRTLSERLDALEAAELRTSAVLDEILAEVRALRGSR